jgi:hypothetical protein
MLQKEEDRTIVSRMEKRLGFKIASKHYDTDGRLLALSLQARGASLQKCTNSFIWSLWIWSENCMAAEKAWTP